MDSKQKEEIYELFGDAFRDVVPPLIEDLKKDLREIKEDTGQIERKLDNITDSHAKKLGDHERRLERLEKSRVVS